VCTFDEADYRFGAGPLTMTVEAVDWANPVLYDNETWYDVVGTERTREGRDIGRRRALVRARQLRMLSEKQFRAPLND
jgi:hypothetical protein